MLQTEPPDGCRPVGETSSAAPEWLLLLRAGVSRERIAMAVALAAVSAAVLVIVVIPVISGRIG